MRRIKNGCEGKGLKEREVYSSLSRLIPSFEGGT